MKIFNHQGKIFDHAIPPSNKTRGDFVIKIQKRNLENCKQKNPMGKVFDSRKINQSVTRTREMLMSQGILVKVENTKETRESCKETVISANNEINLSKKVNCGENSQKTQQNNSLDFISTEKILRSRGILVRKHQTGDGSLETKNNVTSVKVTPLKSDLSQAPRDNLNSRNRMAFKQKPKTKMMTSKSKPNIENKTHYISSGDKQETPKESQDDNILQDKKKIKDSLESRGIIFKTSKKPKLEFKSNNNFKLSTLDIAKEKESYSTKTSFKQIQHFTKSSLKEKQVFGVRGSGAGGKSELSSSDGKSCEVLKGNSKFQQVQSLVEGTIKDIPFHKPEPGNNEVTQKTFYQDCPDCGEAFTNVHLLLKHFESSHENNKSEGQPQDHSFKIESDNKEDSNILIVDSHQDNKEDIIEESIKDESLKPKLLMLEYFPSVLNEEVESDNDTDNGCVVLQDYCEESDQIDEDLISNVDDLEDFYEEYEETEVEQESIDVGIDIYKILGLPTLPMITYEPRQEANSENENSLTDRKGVRDPMDSSSEDELDTDGESDEHGENIDGMPAESNLNETRNAFVVDDDDDDDDFEIIDESFPVRTQEEYDSDDEYDRLYFGFKDEQDDIENREGVDTEEINIEIDVPKAVKNQEANADEEDNRDRTSVIKKEMVMRECFIKLKRIQKEILRPFTVDLVRISVKEYYRGSEESFKRLRVNEYLGENDAKRLKIIKDNLASEKTDHELNKIQLEDYNAIDNIEAFEEDVADFSDEYEEDDFDEILDEEISEFEMMELMDLERLEDIESIDKTDILDDILETVMEEVVEPWTEYI